LPMSKVHGDRNKYIQNVGSLVGKDKATKVFDAAAERPKHGKGAVGMFDLDVFTDENATATLTKRDKKRLNQLDDSHRAMYLLKKKLKAGGELGAELSPEEKALLGLVKNPKAEAKYHLMRALATGQEINQEDLGKLDKASQARFQLMQMAVQGQLTGDVTDEELLLVDQAGPRFARNYLAKRAADSELKDVFAVPTTAPTTEAAETAETEETGESEEDAETAETEPLDPSWDNVFEIPLDELMGDAGLDPEQQMSASQAQRQSGQAPIRG
jgi:hypothetical protein